MKSIARVLLMLVLLGCVPGCMTCCYRGDPGKLAAFSNIQNPTQVANDIWTRLLANYFTNESHLYTFSFADDEVWRVKPGSEIRRFIYRNAVGERHIRITQPDTARYVLGVAITNTPEGKKAVFTLHIDGEEGDPIVHTTTLATP